MFAYGFSPGPIKQADATQLSLMARQLAGLMQPIVTGSFGMVRAADGRPIIYSIPTSGTGTGTLNVCGAPIPPTPGCIPCDVHDSDIAQIQSVGAMSFEKCLFVVTPTHDCGSGSGSGSGSSSSANPLTAHVTLGGATENVAVLLGAKFCPDTCEVLTWNRTLCFKNGLYIGHLDDDEPDCP